ncbi:MAG: serine/threonine-protein kinase, partial [Polyangiaceae bacterium]
MPAAVGDGSPRADDARVLPGDGATARHADGGALAARYALGEVLGEGGMGVVRACHDQRIGRDVALKTVRDEHSSRADLVARFLREACVQGQLEHPSIVPVYDLGYDGDGRAYFTMKRVRGATFEQIVAALRRGSDDAARSFPLRKLLGAFATVCHALHFANSRGVIHRDLKPGNVMLGDFGEVYVLDWGLAKLRLSAASTDADDVPVQSPAAQGSVGSHVSGKSAGGATMGTPGYMAPEQVRG